MPASKPASPAASGTARRRSAAASADPGAAPPPVVLVSGPEDLLAERAVTEVIAAVRAAAGDDIEVHRLTGGTLTPGQLAVLVSPSLFGGRKVVVVGDAQDIPAAAQPELKAYVAAPADDANLVLVHVGGNKGKAVAEAARAAGAREIVCAKLTTAGDRLTFVRNEFRVLGRSIGEDAARSLLDAVGQDLREIAAACRQLAADIDGAITEEAVGRYYRGRADTTSFAVADLAVEGRTAEALESLRWALSVGVAPVLITSALAQGVRNIGRLGAAPRGMRPADLARDLGMPPWKINRVRQQLRGWTPAGITTAVQAVAAADAEVKGGGADPAYALERLVVTVSRACQAR